MGSPSCIQDREKDGLRVVLFGAREYVDQQWEQDRMMCVWQRLAGLVRSQGPRTVALGIGVYVGKASKY